MSFPDGTKTENEAMAAHWGAGLIRMGDDAWIEQCRRFEGIFVQKIGSDQLALYLGESGVRRKGLLHFIGTRLECLKQVAVATLEVLKDIGELGGRRFGIERQDPGNDVVRRILSVRLRSRGSVAGLNGRTTTLAGSGRK
jgi:hypothetical protein